MKWLRKSMANDHSSEFLVLQFDMVFFCDIESNTDDPFLTMIWLTIFLTLQQFKSDDHLVEIMPHNLNFNLSFG